VGATHKDDRRDRGGHRAMILDASVGRSGVRIGSSPRFQFFYEKPKTWWSSGAVARVLSDCT
jgi:hypothetical protein